MVNFGLRPTSPSRLPSGKSSISSYTISGKKTLNIRLVFQVHIFSENDTKTDVQTLPVEAID